MNPTDQPALPPAPATSASKPLMLTTGQAAMLFEAAELVTQLAHAADDFDAFCDFNFEDMVVAAFPEVSGSDYSPAYRRLEAALRKAFPHKLAAPADRADGLAELRQMEEGFRRDYDAACKRVGYDPRTGQWATVSLDRLAGTGNAAGDGGTDEIPAD